MKQTFAVCAISLALFIGLLSRATIGVAVTGPLVPIVAEQSRMQDIRESDLRRIFLGYGEKDPDGRPLIPLNHPAGVDARARFDRIVLGFSPDEAAKYWIDQRIRGAIHPPRSASPEGLLQRVVAKLPGAISYVPAASVIPGVKALSVDGRRPGDARYPL